METKRDSKISETHTNSIIKWDSEDVNTLKNELSELISNTNIFEVEYGKQLTLSNIKDMKRVI